MAVEPGDLRTGDVQVLVNIDVDDLERAIAFYSGGIGLRLGRRLGNAGVEMVGGSANFYLLLKDEGSAAYDGDGAPRRSYARHWTPVHLDFVTDDLESAVRRALAAGARLERPSSTHSWGSIAVLADPFGNGFCLIEFSERGYDAVATEA